MTHKTGFSLQAKLGAILIFLFLLVGVPGAVYAAAVGTAFTYQGNLTDGGSPANGPYDFEFKLFDAATGGSQIGSTIVKDNVAVSDGFFNVVLDFGSQFAGQARFLEIGVRPGASTGSFSTFTSRQELTPTPYALGLRPGAVIQGTSAIALSGISTGNSANSAGVYGEAGGSNGYGVWGQGNTNTGGVLGQTSANTIDTPGVKGVGPASGVIGEATNTGYGVQGIGPIGVSGSSNSIGSYGVYGQFDATSGAGVYGNATNTSGINYGVHGVTESLTGDGVFGQITNPGSLGAGVRGEGPNWGVIGEATTTSGTGIGVRGEGRSTGVYGASEGWGVSGYSSEVNGRGVSGQAGSDTGVNYGVYGETDSASGYGGFFVNTNGGNLLAANNANSTSDLEFRVDSSGNVYSDGGYRCGAAGSSGIFNIALGGGASGLQEGTIVSCLSDNSPADFAEMLPIATADPLEPGDVLVVGSDGNLTRSTRAYQPTVVGVYSTRPSYLGNAQFAQTDGFAPLALVGVVPVKATAENGAIQPGDMLVASSLPGHAMRADQDAVQGTVIGKALSPLEEETGLIKILVMLQ